MKEITHGNDKASAAIFHGLPSYDITDGNPQSDRTMMKKLSFQTKKVALYDLYIRQR